MSESERPVLTVEGLTVCDRASDFAIVTDVSFSLDAGEFVCLTGPSGSGKSTLALALIRLLPDALAIKAGSVRLGATELTTASDETLARIRGKDVSIIPQDPLAGLNPVLRCGVQVEEPLRLHTEWDRAQRREAALSMFVRMGLDQPDRCYRSLPTQLSGGQRQRVMLAMAAILQPRVLIADEPTTALDPLAGDLILDLLSRMRDESGTTILFITHDLTLVRRRGTRTIAIDQGRLIRSRVSQAPVIGRRRTRDGSSGSAYPSTQSPMLEVRGLTKSFHRSTWVGGVAGQVRVLSEVSLNLRAGDVVGVVGASGQGKTTLGRCIAGLEAPDKGSISLNGEPLPPIGRAPHPVQIVYQSPYASLNPLMSIGAAIQEGLRARGVAKLTRRGKVLSLLQRVGLPEAYYGRMPRELSGGERQRVVIARCLAAEPKLLIADEPTASLDDRAKRSILELLLEQARTSGLAILLISHDQETVTQICDRVLRLEGARLSPDPAQGAMSTANCLQNQYFSDRP